MSVVRLFRPKVSSNVKSRREKGVKCQRLIPGDVGLRAGLQASRKLRCRDRWSQNYMRLTSVFDTMVASERAG